MNLKPSDRTTVFYIDPASIDSRTTQLFSYAGFQTQNPNGYIIGRHCQKPKTNGLFSGCACEGWFIEAPLGRVRPMRDTIPASVC
jgi:hypothetical protein